ncbi:MAG: hypothetical protein V4667_11865 [Bacteroidota bacterium]
MPILFVWTLSLCFFSSAFGQGKVATEEDIKKTANKNFEEQNYAAALPMYSQLLSLNTKEVLYHYRFGVCNLYAGKDKTKPISFLEYAAKDPSTDKEVFYHLGRAYHLNYKFGEALTNYIKFKQVAPPKLLEKLDVELQIRMCKNGLELLKNIRGLSVMEKKDLRDADYFRAYDLSKINAKVIVKPDEYKTSIDKKKNESSVIVSRFDAKELFFSSYGEVGNAGKDIFRVTKMPDGKWSKPVNAGNVINTPYDEDYPYLHPDGHTFYFCSKGHNSMGGYDVFRCEYDTTTQTFTNPENVDFPISSTDDDILYITDKDNETAYFSSKRISGAGEITIYKVKVDRVAMALALVKGTFSAEDESKHPKAKLTVTNIDNGRQIGVLNLKEGEGKFTLYLPTGTNYAYKLESLGYVTQTETVNFPEQSEMTTLEQKLLLKKEGGADKLIVVNQFRTASDDEKKILTSADVLRQQADISVNYNPNQVKVVAAKKDTTPSKKEEVIKLAENTVKKLEQSQSELKIQSNASMLEANARNQEAEKLKILVKELETKVATLPENQKVSESQKLVELQAKQLEQAREALVAYNIAKDLEQRLTTTTSNLNKETSYLSQIKTAYAKNDNATFDKAAAQHIKLNESQISGTDFIVNSLNEDQKKNKEEINKLEAKNAKITNEINEVKQEIADAQKQSDANKDKAIKASFTKQIFELNEEIRLKENRLGESNIAIAELTEKNRIADDQKQIISGNKLKTSVSPVNPTELAALTKQMEEYKQKEILQRPIIVTRLSTGTNTQLATEVTTTTVTSTTVATTKVTTTTPTNVTSTTVATTKVTTTTPTNVTSTTVATTKVTTTTPTNVTSTTVATTKVTTTTPTNVTSTTVESNTEIKNAITQTEQINTNYTNKLAVAEKITDVKQKEEQKVKLLSEWNAELNNNLTQINSLSATNNLTPNDKKLIEETRLKSEQKVNENKTVISASTQLLASNNTATNTTNNVVLTGTPQEKTKQAETAIASINSNYQTQLTTANSIQNNEQKQIEKNKIVENWNKDLQSIATQLNTVQNSTNVSAEDKKAIQNSITQINTQTAINNSSSSLAANKTNNVVTKDSAVATTAISTFVPNDAEVSASTNSTITNSEAKAELKQVEKLNKERQNFLVEADNLDKKAQKVTNASEKKDLAIRSKQMTEQAKERGVEAQKTNSIANEIQYQNNDAVIQNYIEASKQTDESKLQVATLNAEAKNYNTEAFKFIIDAESTSDLTKKEALYKKAADYEKVALSKQQNAIQLLKGNDGKFKITVTPITAIAVKEERVEKIETAKNNKKQLGLNAQLKANADSLAAIEKAKNSATKDSTNQLAIANNKSPFDSTSTTKVQKTQDYNNYIVLKNEAKLVENKSVEQQKQAEEYRAKSNEYSTSAKDFDAIASATTDATQKNQALQKANVARTNQNRFTVMADSVSQLAQNNNNEAIAKNTEAETFLQQLDKDLYEKAVTAYNQQNKTTNANNTVVTSNTNTVASTETPIEVTQLVNEKNELKTEKVFEQAKAPVYSSVKPIPIDPKLPSGIVFKVQIGAFRNPIPADLFQGFNPVMGETTPNGITRYTAGFFKNFEGANQARREINGLGYRDAFVVAFCNGKRIPVEQAQEFVRKGVSCDGQQLAANTTVSNATNTTANNANTTNLTNTNNTTTVNNTTTTATVTNRTNVAQATELNKVQGLLYTVQVGVYARPVTSDRLFNIIPLYVAVADNGYLRYSSGIYNNTDAANQARNYIVNVGIKDAFVVAYYNGKRISVAEAKQLEAQQGASVYASTASANTQPTRGTAPAAISNLNTTTVTSTNVATTTTAVETVKPQIVYKVQIGAFKEEVPLDKAKIFFNLSMKGPIANYVTDEKVTIFTFGSFTDYETANSSKNDMINEGLSDAFVVAYSNGNKITIEEAKRLNGK